MFRTFYQDRKNTTTVWNPGDTEENYKPLNLNGPNYTVDDFSYTFNSDGFRCDEFSEVSDFPVVFTGCSYTEGIGLPLHEMWTTHLINRLKKELPGARIPTWNMGLGGSGIDYTARVFVEFAPILKPKYMFYLLGSIHRREFAYGDTLVQTWFPNATNMFKPSMVFNMLGRLFSDEHYAMYRTHVSLLLMQQTAKLSNTKVFVFDMMHGQEDELKKDALFANFENIEYFKLRHVPYDFPDKIVLPPEMSHLRNSPWMARDNSHPGAVWQYAISEQIWDLVKDKMIMSA